jgi:Peptidase family M20/M25/M40/Permease for cytosine/purines, uracil, thiamine, allantoin
MANQEGVTGTGTTPDEALLPTWRNQRALTFWGFNYIWIGLAVVIVTFLYEANGVAAGYSIPTVLAIVWFATATLAILMTATADIGTEHGLSFAVYLRALFGTVGTHLPAVSRGCDYSWELRQETPAVPADPNLSALVAKAVEDSGLSAHRLPSGAGHDAAQMAAVTPIAMLFVRCKEGISHNPAESVTKEDVGAAIEVIGRFLTLLAEGERSVRESEASQEVSS